MKRLLIDTNIVLDLLSGREPFYRETALLFSEADRKKVELNISSLTIANLGYILRRQMNVQESKEVMRKLSLIVNTLPLDEKIIGMALNDNAFEDFEDALQYFTAIEHDLDIIITRNLKDFKASALPVMTAQQFLEAF